MGLIMSTTMMGQWQLAMNITGATSSSGDPSPAKPTNSYFTSALEGLHVRYKYLSPSSGSTSSLYHTSDGGETWAIIAGTSGTGTGLDLFGGIPEQNEFFFRVMGFGAGVRKFVNGQGVSAMTGVWSGTLSPVDSSLIYVLERIAGTTFISTYENGQLTGPHDSLPNITVGFPRHIGRDSIFVAVSGVSYAPKRRVLCKMGLGDAWNEIFADTAVSITSISFRSQYIGYVLCNGRELRRTENGGITWETVLFSDSVMNSMFFLNDSIGLLGGNGGVVHTTLDGGDTWTTEQLPTDRAISWVTVFENGTAYAQVKYVMNYTPISLQIYESQLVVGMDNVETVKPPLQIFPNPTKGSFKIIGPSKIQRVELVDRTGRVVEVEKGDADGLWVAPRSLQTGAYFVRVFGDGGRYGVTKLVLTME